MELGYRFYPLSILGHPGNRALEVVVKAQPTLKHFDPEKIRVMVGTEKQLIATVIISNSLPFPFRRQPHLECLDLDHGEVLVEEVQSDWVSLPSTPDNPDGARPPMPPGFAGANE